MSEYTSTLLSHIQSHTLTDLGLIFDAPDAIQCDAPNLGIGYNVFMCVMVKLKETWEKWRYSEDLISGPESEILACLGEAFWKSRLWLLLYGDDYNQWNWRRGFFLRVVFGSPDAQTPKSPTAPRKHHQTLISNELQFIDLVLSKHVKSEEAWSYRKWLLQEILRADLTYSYEHELLIAQQGYERYYRNYYAWNFRYFVVEQEYLERDTQHSVIYDELDRMFAFLRKNISDYTAVNHITRVCDLYLCEVVRRREQGETQDAGFHDALLRRFLKFYLLNQFLITCYPGHEALWLQRRSLQNFLWNYILSGQLVGDTGQSPDSLASLFDEVRREMEESYAMDPAYKYNTQCTLQEETSFLESIQIDANMDQYEKQNEYALTYMVWLCRILERQTTPLTAQQSAFLGVKEESNTAEVLERTHSSHLNRLRTLLRDSKDRAKNLPEELQGVVLQLQRHRLRLYTEHGDGR